MYNITSRKKKPSKENILRNIRQTYIEYLYKYKVIEMVSRYTALAIKCTIYGATCHVQAIISQKQSLKPIIFFVPS